MQASLPQDGNQQAFTPTSIVLERLIREAPEGYFTLAWLTSRLRERSFGMIMLLLAVIAIGPVVSPIAGLLLAFPAIQMIANQDAPSFPRFIADRPLPTKYLAALAKRSVPVLRRLEKIVLPLWPTP